MFEATLEAQSLDVGENRFRSLATAVLAHASVVGAVVAITAMIIPTPPVPEPTGFVIVLPRFQDFDKAMGPHDPLPAISRPRPATGARPVTPVVPQPIEQPRETPSTIPGNSTADVPGPDSNGGEGGANDDGGGSGSSGGGEGDGNGDGTGSGLDEGPRELTAEMIRPVLVSKIEPVYPQAARVARLPGRVVVEAIIGLDGRVESVVVLSSTNVLFDEAALTAVRKWVYTPARMNGAPVRVYFTAQVSFVLR